MVLLLVTVIENIDYTLNQIFCRKQSFVYLQFYLYCKGKIVNKQRIVCDRISGSRYTNSANNIVGVLRQKKNRFACTITLFLTQRNHNQRERKTIEIKKKKSRDDNNKAL